jgi:hypothetical protein
MLLLPSCTLFKRLGVSRVCQIDQLWEQYGQLLTSHLVYGAIIGAFVDHPVVLNTALENI